ncbi:2C-methyl-D-erythritol 2,4-cyclodiphosphate synthase(EC:4.6.1.12) [Cronobacter sakazakii 701]|nr:2C-methyl-D-erythritol 2,4-cyclodiphosphate synthase(EC:4.6.1.12) [Cronobacter sakazakii 701]
MLLRQKRGRHQHRHLFIVLDRQERRAHSHFGFTEAHVAAHQTIHRQRLAHVAQHRVNRLRLIGRSLKREPFAEELILLFVMLKGETGFRGALGVDIQQLRRHIAHFFRRFLARFRPRVAAKLVQRRVLFGTACVAADEMQRRHWHIELRIVGIGEHQVFRRDAARFKRRQPRVAAHAMLQMHHRLAGAQLRQVADERIRVDGAAALLATARDALAKQIALANKRALAQGIDKSALGRADAQIALTRLCVFKPQKAFRHNFNARKEFRKRLAAAFTFHRENHRAGERLQKTAQTVERRFLLRLHGDIRQRLVAQIGIGGFVSQRLGFQLHARPGF